MHKRYHFYSVTDRAVDIKQGRLKVFMFESHDEREYVIILAIDLFIGRIQSERQRQLLLSRTVTEPRCMDGHILAEAASIGLTMVMVDSPLPVIQSHEQRLMQAIFHIVDSAIAHVLSSINFSMETRCPAEEISIYVSNSSKGMNQLEFNAGGEILREIERCYVRCINRAGLNLAEIFIEQLGKKRVLAVSKVLQFLLPAYPVEVQ
jgi:hypothetical protein